MKQSIAVLMVLVLLNILVFAAGQPVFAAAKLEKQVSESITHKMICDRKTENRD